MERLDLASSRPSGRARVRSVKGSEWVDCNLRTGRKRLCSDDGNPGAPSAHRGLNMILVTEMAMWRHEGSVAAPPAARHSRNSPRFPFADCDPGDRIGVSLENVVQLRATVSLPLSLIRPGRRAGCCEPPTTSQFRQRCWHPAFALVSLPRALRRPSSEAEHSGSSRKSCAVSAPPRATYGYSQDRRQKNPCALAPFALT